MEGLVDALRGVGGANVRIVASIGAVDYDVAFVREDLEGVYDESDFEEAYRNVVSNQIAAEDFGQASRHGQPEAQVYLFESVVVCLLPSSRYEGVFASFDRDDPFPINAVVDTAAEHRV